MFLSRPWHAPGLTAALLAFVLGALGGLAYTAGPASAEEPSGPKVTLSQSTDLVNQRIKVGWSGFMPNRYALGIYQCRGTVPKGSECDGVTDEAINPETGLPRGSVVGHRATFGASGSEGEGWIQVLPKSDRPSLGCGDDTECILAVVLRPAPGSTPQNLVPANSVPGSGHANIPLSSEFDLAVQGGQAAWAPLHFAPEPGQCADRGVALRLGGNSEHNMAGLSWQGGMCRAAEPMMTTVTAGTSPEGRDTFRNGTVDAAITTQPLGGPLDQSLGTASSGQPGRKAGEVVYAPVTNGAIVLAANLEVWDASGQPVMLPPLNLTPRLVAKLLTDAYRIQEKYKSGSLPKKEVPGFPPTYDHYRSLFEDPEFTAINPGLPGITTLHGILVRGVNDDTIHELTRWLLSDQATRDWLGGAVDENGIACPDAWRIPQLEYPIGLLTNRIEERESQYRPIGSYWTIADNLGKAQGPEMITGVGGLPKSVDPDPPGARAVIGITSLEAAERMKLPVVRLRNAAGEFVAPTTESISAGVAAAKRGADGVTLSNDFAATDPKAYPLTTTDVVALPTKGLTTELAASIDTYLAYASGPGQVGGLEPGRLPPGYAPLNATQKQQVTAAREAVRKAAAVVPPNTQTPSPTPTRDSAGGTLGTSGGSDGEQPGGQSPDGANTDDAAATGGTGGGGTGASPPPGNSPSPSSSPRTGPAAASGDDGPENLPAALAERIKQALRGDPSAILFLVLSVMSLGAAVAAPVLLGIGWRRRTGNWPPPVAALISLVRRRPTGAS
ncbi:hypothetical protein [Yinghuangia sp. YIM S09857]|uniref:hypothetical protein n=1 Tax=Yinghuangia sp. YIM S09857 TaxID=3436929 RepID=UPI003F537626